MFVKNITWLSVEAAEAEVQVTDGVYECVAFSWPCAVAVGDDITEPLHVFDMRNAKLVQNVQTGIWALDQNSLARRVVAELVDLDRQIVGVGGIWLIAEETLPAGIKVGALLEFDCARLDLW
ncbi:hypothetical protein [Pseudoduganella armeniaca]|uniref:Uncharacterized protein n=1 Tax=Pseudoduganella armeniaca TaxID=2072590 RepID=A0A2R4CD95_9BURK|nr:hypothetical protein [Pseudoduganella armeniaca]AVR97438.1 hypothetical protein C9I28_18660 [Pseudoduganella armeniaca]